MHVGDHRPDVPRRHRNVATFNLSFAAIAVSAAAAVPSSAAALSSSVAAETLAPVDVRRRALVPKHSVPFVDRIDAASLGNADAALGEQKLPERRVEGEDRRGGLAEAEHEHARGAVEAVAGRDQVPPGPQRALRCGGSGGGGSSWGGGSRGRGGGSSSSCSFSGSASAALAVDPEDRPDRHPAVDVRGAVERVEDHDVVPRRVFDDDRRVVLLGDHRRDLPRPTEAGDEDVVGQDVQLLLVLALDVLWASRQAEDAGEAGLLKMGERRRRKGGGGDKKERRKKEGGGEGCVREKHRRVEFWPRSPSTSFSYLPDRALHKRARHARCVEEDGEVASGGGGEEVLWWR